MGEIFSGTCPPGLVLPPQHSPGVQHTASGVGRPQQLCDLGQVATPLWAVEQGVHQALWRRSWGPGGRVPRGQLWEALPGWQNPQGAVFDLSFS